MATARERAAIGAEEARLEGRGPGGRAAEGAKNAVTNRDTLGGPNNLSPVNTGYGADGTNGNRGLIHDGLNEPGAAGFGHPHNGAGLMERTEAELAHLRNRTEVTGEGEAYCPNPNLRDLPKEYETRVQVIQRYPEMKTVEKTDFVKEIFHEDRLVIVPKTRVIMDEVERIDIVPVVKQVPRTRIEIVHRVVTEEREVTDMVPMVENVEVSRIEKVPRVITEDVEEMMRIPVVREVPVTRMVEVPTGNYCEAPAGEFINPGHFNLLGKGVGTHQHGVGTHQHGVFNRTKSSSSDEFEDAGVVDDGVHTSNVDGTPTTPSGRRKTSLLRRIEAKLTNH